MSGVFDLGSSAANSSHGLRSPAASRTVLGYEANQYSAVETQVDDVFESVAIAETCAATRRSPVSR